MKFKLEGCAGPVTERPQVRRMREFIEALPDGRLLTVERLCGELGLNEHYASAHVARFIPAALKVKHNGPRLIYGNAKTIQAWRQARGLHD